MPWKEEYSEDEIRTLLASIDIKDWEIDIGFLGDIELLVPKGERLTHVQVTSLLKAFSPTEINIEAIHTDLPYNGDLMLRVNLVFDKTGLWGTELDKDTAGIEQ